ncbi:MAG: ABC transporter substrate-binding protein [Candidatus Acidiferrales bacterium]|jgi:iron complex transport system substrate-binding protein
MKSIRPTEKLRIVSLAPSVTSILFAIGAGKNLVGVSKWCKDVAPVGKLPRVGDCWALDVRAVQRLRPTLVIGSVPFKAEVVAELLELPVSFLALNPRSLRSIEEDCRTLGRITNRLSSANALVEKMRSAFARVRARVARLPRNAKRRPRIYCEAWPNPRISSPPWVAELVEISGGRMAVPPGKRISNSDVANARPDVIVLAWTATGERANPRATLANPNWSRVLAVRNERVVVIRDEWLNTPGPPLMHGAKALFRALYPSLHDHPKLTR